MVLTDLASKRVFEGVYFRSFDFSRNEQEALPALSLGSVTALNKVRPTVKIASFGLLRKFSDFERRPQPTFEMTVLDIDRPAIMTSEYNRQNSKFVRTPLASFALLMMGVLVLHSASAATPVQQAYIKASNTKAPSPGESFGNNQNFGWSIAVAGDTMVIGAPFENSSATGVNGNQASNGAPDSGAAYVFVRNGTNWIQQAYLKASNTGANDLFGWRVAISGNTIVVSAVFEDSSATGVNGNQTNNGATDSGAAYVFVRDGTNWIQQAYLKASNTGADDHFGLSVAISGDTIVVGADKEDSNATGVNGNQSNNSAMNSGAAYVFVRDGTSWSQQAYLKASNTGGPSSGDSDGDNFGASVTISGDTIVVGAHEEDSSADGVNGNQSDNSAHQSGAAYVFVRSGSQWSQQAYLKASNSGPSASFGWSTALSGDTLVVGAPDEKSSATGVNGDERNSSATEAGAAYVFVRTGTNWIQQAYLKASNTDAADHFGVAVAVSDNLVLVGASQESSNATGVNGNQNDNRTEVAGAAYVFARSGTTWSQQAYLKASNTRAFAEFGISVSVSGDTVVVGADGDFSNATGVNGDQGNTNAPFSGAAYVFIGLQPPPPQLVIERAADKVRILWPLTAANFVLEESGDISASSTVGWTPAPFPYETNTTSISVTVPLGVQTKFYRMRKP